MHGFCGKCICMDFLARSHLIEKISYFSDTKIKSKEFVVGTYNSIKGKGS
jgi:hypothetical protein